MGAYHDNNRDSWFSSFYYTDWTGKKKKKLKRGFPTNMKENSWRNAERNHP